MIKVKWLSLLTTFFTMYYIKKTFVFVKFFCLVFQSYMLSPVFRYISFSISVCSFFCYCLRSKFMLLCISNIIKQKTKIRSFFRFFLICVFLICCSNVLCFLIDNMRTRWIMVSDKNHLKKNGN